MSTLNGCGEIQYLAVVENDDDDVTEMPTEDDGLLLLETLTAQFPNAIGLKFRSIETGNFRAIRVANGVMKPPEGGWKAHTFFVVYPKGVKRDTSGVSDAVSVSTKRVKSMEDSHDTQDLIVLGLPWKMTEEELQEHFEQYGKIVFCQIKRNGGATGQSRGYGFIRYDNIAGQTACLVNRHYIEGRHVEVKIPDSSVSTAKNVPLYNRKIYVKMITEVSSKDLREYFSQHGNIVEFFSPIPFKGYAFITFEEPGLAHKLYGEHTINGIKVEVKTAAPKRTEDNPKFGWGQQGGQQQGGYNRGGAGGYGAGGGAGGYGAGGGASGGYAGGTGGYGTGTGYTDASADPFSGMNPTVAAAAMALLANMGAGGAGGYGGGGTNMPPPPTPPSSTQNARSY